MRDAVGGTYRFEESARNTVEGTLKKAVDKCLTSVGRTQGTAYLAAKVATSGVLSDVIVSPGGAVSTKAVECMRKSFGETRVPTPRDDESVLLLFLVSSCPMP